MTPAIPPVIRELNDQEITELLGRHHVGRVAFSLHDRVDIEPISYVYEEGWIYGRTSMGTKLNILARRPWVAFEVDEVHGPGDWESAVVHGTFYHLEPECSEHDIARFHRAFVAVRRVMPKAFGDEDPVAFRDVLFGIHIHGMSGRASSTGS
jgi:nitroimidazol reductase NimA-like FMN-containing flavoprotein (pyridoxamine 5'-phosphate oxidase superfamily)